MPLYLTPGVYFERIDAAERRIPALRTDVAGFVGIAERGPLNRPVRIESWKQFQSVFGGFVPQGYLSYAVKGFFENSGLTCYVVRIADRDAARRATVTLADRSGIPTVKVYALNEGRWGNMVKVSLKGSCRGSTVTADPSKQPADGSYSVVQRTTGFERGSLVRVFQNRSGIRAEEHHYVRSIDVLNRKIVWDTPLSPAFDSTMPIYFSTMEFTLTFTLGSELKEVFDELSLNRNHSRYLEDVVNGRSNLVLVEDLASPSAIPDNLPDPAAFREGFVRLEGGTDGISTLSMDDFLGDPGADEKEGLRCYEDVDEVGMICIPDIMTGPTETEPPPPPEKPDPCAPPEEATGTYSPPMPESPPLFGAGDIERAQRAMIGHCEMMKDRVAILDPPPGSDVAGIHEWRLRFDSKYAALYYPWIVVNDPLRLRGNITRVIPPSGHVAGVYARTDLTRGVHKAPANETVLGAEDTAPGVDDPEQELLNPVGVNCLRAFPGRGVLIWGARTVSTDPAWRYINIRRLLIMIEESLMEAMQWTVFEPNDVYLRKGISVSVSCYLEELWRQGALVGKTASEAFFVQCDEENNPKYVIDAGRIITDIGVAPSIPGEFILFRIGKVKDGLEVLKEGA